MFIALIVADFLMAIVFAFRYLHLPPQIPLFYSELWGDNQLADIWYILLIPFFLHVFYFLNLFIYRKYFWQNQIVKNILYKLNWFLIIAFTGIFLKIVFLVS